MIYLSLSVILVATALSAMAVSLSRPVAYRFGYLDAPHRHKAHTEATPMLGGAAMFVVILMLSLFATALGRYWAAVGAPEWMPASLAEHIPGAAERAMMAIWILLGALVLHVLGLIDDRKNLGPIVKLAVQFAVAIGVVLSCETLRVLTVAGSWGSGILTVLWIVGICNAFNFLDNMDGLAGGVAAIVAGSLLAASASAGQIFVPAWLCVILGALIGFLLFNFPPAKVFMGDAGSLVIGYLLAVLSALTTYTPPGETFYAYGVFVPLIIMAVPLYDMISVVSLRLRDRKSPMVGDRRHFSHRLIRRGMSVPKAVGTIYLCTAATAIGAALLPRVDTVGAVLVFVQTLMILLILALLESTDKKG